MEFRINRVYTRSGDAGETGLVGGRRVKKNSPRVIAYGEIDELNSCLGMVKEELSPATAELSPVIEELQQQLFDLGSEVATAPADKYDGMWQVSDNHVKALETLCDKFGDGLPELKSFILPGGSRLAANLHLARCVCRRAERSLVQLSDSETLNPQVVVFTNRVSDFLFVAARWALKKENKDAPLWVKEADRA